jgi:hypothetical protein
MEIAGRARNDGFLVPGLAFSSRHPGVDSPVIPSLTRCSPIISGLTRDLILGPIMEIACRARNDGFLVPGLAFSSRHPGVDSPVIPSLTRCSPVIPGLTRDLILNPIMEIAGRARNDGFLVPGLDPGPHPGPHHRDCGAELDSVPQ